VERWGGPRTVRRRRGGGGDDADRAGGRLGGGGPILRAVTLPGRVVVYDGDAHRFDLPDPLDLAAEAGGGGDRIEAPMPGLVKAVFVARAETVAKGARLAVLEAMKMEHV
jgi:3-methylcrotonyl-CoA carboxylase alpha subunit